jgi:hypothetical protein
VYIMWICAANSFDKSCALFALPTGRRAGGVAPAARAALVRLVSVAGERRAQRVQRGRALCAPLLRRVRRT